MTGAEQGPARSFNWLMILLINLKQTISNVFVIFIISGTQKSMTKKRFFDDVLIKNINLF